MFQFQKNLKNVRSSLLEWRKKEGTNSSKQIIALTSKMDRMREKGGQMDWESWNKIRSQLDEAYKEDEEY